MRYDELKGRHRKGVREQCEALTRDGVQPATVKKWKRKRAALWEESKALDTKIHDRCPHPLSSMITKVYDAIDDGWSRPAWYRRYTCELCGQTLHEEVK